MSSNNFMIQERLAKAFTPTQPVSLPDLLSGRLELLFHLQIDINTPGQHVLLYGDRGVGKTSVARVLAVLSQEDEPRGRRSILVSCDSTDTYGSIWRKVFQEVLLVQRQLGFAQQETWNIAGRFDPEDTIESPNDLRLLINSLPNPAVVIIDEFDRIQDCDTRLLMTDTLKLFADTGTNCSVVLVGVARSIEDVIGAHASISRNLDYVQVDPMRPEELAEIVTKGFGKVGLEVEPGLDFRVAQMSQGYPHYTHLLALWAGHQTIQRGGDFVSQDDLRNAIPYSIRNAAGGIRIEYDLATDSSQPNNLFKEVLLACAMAEKDVRGRFALRMVREPLQRILNRKIEPVSYQRHLAAFSEPERGTTLVKTGRRRHFRWHFANPQLIPFVLLQGINDGLISDEHLLWKD